MDVVKNYGEITIVAPAEPMSGVGHAITMREPIYFREDGEHFPGIKSFAVTGTPADCVKLGIGTLMDKKPSLVFSGINHGSNASVNMIYSGTVAAAIEGSLYGAKSIAFSVLNYHDDADLTLAAQVVNEIMEVIDQIDIPPYSLLNVNIPDIPVTEYKGLRFSRQSMAYWREEFVEEPGVNGEKAYWLKGEFFCEDKTEDTDIWALENNFASVVPVYLDLTHHYLLNNMRKKFPHERI